ncbi:DNA polymerase [Vibrio harveyi]|uniref:DNA polymerase n=1 Tax=Vibrio harveyi TaxID=669 RepID=UPI003CF998CF
MTHKTIIIDASKLSKSSSAIEETTAVCRNMLKTYKPEYVTLCIPKSADKQFQHDVRELCAAMGVSLDVSENISGSVKTLIDQSTTKTVIATSNNGMCQFINGSVTVHDLSEDKLIDEKELAVSIGLKPNQIPIFLAICGYPDAGVPAIPFANPQQIIEALQKSNEISFSKNLLGFLPKLTAGKVAPFANQVNQRIKQITNASDGPSVSFTRRKPLDPEKIYAFYLKHKMYRWLPDEVREKHNIFLDGKIGARNVVVNTPRLHQELEQIVKLKGSFAIYVNADVFEKSNLISLCSEQGDSYVLNLSNPESFELFKRLCEDSDLLKVTNESKSLYALCKTTDIKLKSLLSDLQMGSHVVDSHNGKLTFEQKVEKATGINPATASTYFKSTDSEPKRLAGTIDYISDMADLTLRSNRKIYQSLLQTGGVSILKDIELPLSKVLMEIEQTGVKIDADNLKKFGLLIDKKLNDAKKDIKAVAGKDINVNSPKEVSALLYETLKLGKHVDTQDTSEEVLEKLSEFHPLPAKILNCRVLSNMKSNYIDGLLNKIDPVTGRIYTTYQQDPATTGRLSSRDPNLQSIPARRKEARQIKRSFIAEEHFKIYAADYSQVELRILAHLSQDPKLMQAFLDGKDIHRATAAEVFGLKEEMVTKEQRRQAKAINFGLVYGKTAYGLAKDLGLSTQEAQSYIDTYFQRYQGVAKYLASVKAHAKQHGYVTTLMGRRIYTPNINSDNFGTAKKAERSAINAPVQGTAADIMKKAMVSTFNEIIDKGMKSKMLMQIHDELVFEAHESEIQLLDEIVKRNMESAVKLSVPLTVDSDVGLNWEESHSLEDNNNHNMECVA